MDWIFPVVPPWPKATTFELLPERVDLVGFVLQVAGLAALVETAIVMTRRRLPDRAAQPELVERWTIFGAVCAIVLFWIVAAWQRLH